VYVIRVFTNDGDLTLLKEKFVTMDSARRYADLFIAGGYVIEPLGEPVLNMEPQNCKVLSLADARAKRFNNA
jgi:hypothetical protein